MLPTLVLLALQAVAAPASVPEQAAPPGPGARATTPQSALAGTSQPGRRITQYKLERWTDTDGLPQNSLFAVAQTTDRFLWFASEEGLIRFDGESFVVFNQATTPALEQSQMLALAANGSGGLWIGTPASGLLRFAQGEFTRTGTAQGLPSERVQAVAVDDAGSAWAGTNRGLARIDRNGAVTVVEGLPHADVSVLLVRSDAVWAGTPAGLVRISGGTVTVFDDRHGLGTADVRALAPARRGGLWVGTQGGGVFHFDGRRFTPLDARLAAESVTAISEDAGGVWVGTNGSGLHRLTASTLETLNGRNGGADMIWSLLHDVDGSLWVATNGNGLLQLRESPIVPLGAAEGLSEDIALAVFQATDGSRWVGTAGAGVNRIDAAGSVTRFGPADGLTARRVLSIAELPGGDLLLGSSDGLLFRYRGGRFTEIGQALGLTGSVMAILPDPRGGFWLGTTSGLVHAGPAGAPRTLTAADGLADDFIMSLHRSGDGALWVGTRQGVSRVMSGRVVPFAAQPELAGVAVGAFFEPPGGGLWVATQGRGIARIDGADALFLRSTQGLCEDMVHAIVDDGRGSAWMSSNRGIFRLPLREVAAFFDGSRASVRCSLYDRAEGMRSREANGGFMPAGVLLDDGRVMFPTMQGVVSLDPDLFAAAPPPPPPVLKLAVMDADTTGLFTADVLRITTSRRDVEFQFTAPFYRGAERLRFRYMLEGFDRSWRDGGQRRSAHYTNLPPGEYTFRVMAGNEEGAWHAAQAAVRVSVPPRFHETWWFRLLAALAAMALALRLHRARTMAVQRSADRLQALVEERSRAEERYRDLFENASDMVFTTDIAGRITSWNSQAARITGWSREQAVGQPIDRLIQDFGDIAATTRRDVSFRTRAGDPAVMEIASRSIEEQGVVVGYQVIARDMRQWRQMQDQLQQAAKMEAVGVLAGGIAHDFNNLLTVVTSSSAIIDADLPPDSPVRGDVQQIRAAADSAAGLTRQLLAFSRRQVLQPRVVDVNQEVTRVVDMLRRIIGVDIRMETVLADGVWSVRADGGQLEQVLMNLALNARDAMPDGGILRFTTANQVVSSSDEAWLAVPAGNYVVLAIEDTGLGISEEALPHLFEPFFTTKEAGRGTGLGLATVYGVVKQSGGHILVDSTPGEGTRFRIFLPQCDAAAPAAEVDQGGATPRAGQEGTTILLVEDEPAVRKLTERILRRGGFRVVSAGSGGEALAVLESNGPVDLLLTDIVMPGMNGRELARRVRGERPTTRVLYMSGYTEDEVIRGGALPEGEHFLPKPFTPRQMIEAVNAVLDKAAVLTG